MPKIAWGSFIAGVVVALVASHLLARKGLRAGYQRAMQWVANSGPDQPGIDGGTAIEFVAQEKIFFFVL